jgi:hypothetical protein
VISQTTFAEMASGFERAVTLGRRQGAKVEERADEHASGSHNPECKELVRKPPEIEIA